MLKSNRPANKNIVIVIILSTIILATFYMNMDHYLSGDEVITYGMANSNSGGWMLSTGRVQAYFTNEILEDSVVKTMSNLVEFAKDVVVNRGNASYFKYARPSETGWYFQNEMKNWFQVTDENKYSFGRVYLNAMGDDANSFLYYMLVHVVSSLFPTISSMKWSAFIVNVFAYCACTIILYNIGKCYLSSWTNIICCLLWSFSYVCLDMITYLRPYMVESVFQLLLFLIHLQLYNAYQKNDSKSIQKSYLFIFVTYPIGYIIHYTMGLWAVALGMYTIILFGRNKDINLRKYICVGGAALTVGIIIDPFSMLGLLSKLKGSAGENTLSAIKNVGIELIDELFISRTFAIALLAIVIGGLICMERGKNRCCRIEQMAKDMNFSETLLGKGDATLLMLAYCVITVWLTKKAYFRSVYPLLFLTVIMWIEYFLKLIIYNKADRISKRRIIYMMTIVVLMAIYISNTLGCTFNSKKTEGEEYQIVKDYLIQSQHQQIALLRSHAAAYDYLYILPEYEVAYVFTDYEDSFEDCVKEMLAKHEKQICILTGTNEKRKEYETVLCEQCAVEKMYEGKTVSLVEVQRLGIY